MANLYSLWGVIFKAKPSIEVHIDARTKILKNDNIIISKLIYVGIMQVDLCGSARGALWWSQVSWFGHVWPAQKGNRM